jgi:hypothetical protein
MKRLLPGNGNTAMENAMEDGHTNAILSVETKSMELNYLPTTEIQLFTQIHKTIRYKIISVVSMRVAG